MVLGSWFIVLVSWFLVFRLLFIVNNIVGSCYLFFCTFSTFIAVGSSSFLLPFSLALVPFIVLYYAKRVFHALLQVWSKWLQISKTGSLS